MDVLMCMWLVEYSPSYSYPLSLSLSFQADGAGLEEKAEYKAAKELLDKIAPEA